MSIPRHRLMRGAGLLSISAVALATTACGGGTAPVAKPSAPATYTSQQVFDMAKDGTALVYGKEGDSVARGSGWVVDAKMGYVVTNAHVAVGLTAMKVKIAGQTVPATLVGAAPCQDVAVIKMSSIPAGVKQLPVGDSAQVKNQDAVTSLGFPLQGSKQETEGDYANITMTSSSGSVENPSTNAALGASSPLLDTAIQTSANINHGSSGGPLLNDKGQVIGMNSAGASSQNLNYAIASSKIKSLLPQLEAGKFPSYTGLNLEAGTDVDWSQYDSLLQGAVSGTALNAAFSQKKVTGLLVLGVDPGSPAEKANFTSGDLLTTMNNTSVNSMQDVCDILNSVAPGATVGTEGAYVLDATHFNKSVGDTFKQNIVLPQ